VARFIAVARNIQQETEKACLVDAGLDKPV
jgi:hypothetical protein